MTVHVHNRLKCGGDIDGGDFAVGQFDQVSIILNLKLAFGPSYPTPSFLSLSSLNTRKSDEAASSASMAVTVHVRTFFSLLFQKIKTENCTCKNIGQFTNGDILVCHSWDA